MRYLPPLLVLTVGYALWHQGTPVPGTPQVIPGLCPRDLAVDSRGVLYVGDGSNRCIWMMRPGGSIRRVAEFTTTACDGSSLAIGPGGSLLVLDSLHDIVWRLDPSGFRQLVAGAGHRRPRSGTIPATQAVLLSPRAIATDPSGALFILEESAQLLKVDRSGYVSRVALRAGPGKPAETSLRRWTGAPLFDCVDLASDARGDLLVMHYGCVWKTDSAGMVSVVVGTKPARVAVSISEGMGAAAMGEIGTPPSIGSAGAGSRADALDPASLDIVGTTRIAVDVLGRPLLVQPGCNRVRRVERGVSISTAIDFVPEHVVSDELRMTPAGQGSPSVVRCSAQGDLYVLEERSCIWKVNRRGRARLLLSGRRLAGDK